MAQIYKNPILQSDAIRNEEDKQQVGTTIEHDIKPKVRSVFYGKSNAQHPAYSKLREDAYRYPFLEGASDIEELFDDEEGMAAFRKPSPYFVRSFTLDGTRFKTNHSNNGMFIKEVHPYDNAEYAWAKRNPNDTFSIFHKGTEQANIKEYNDLIKALREFNKQIKPERAIY